LGLPLVKDYLLVEGALLLRFRNPPAPADDLISRWPLASSEFWRKKSLLELRYLNIRSPDAAQSSPHRCHGKVSQLMTPLLLSRSWTVTSRIRDPGQTSSINSLGKGQPGKLEVLVRSLEDVTSKQEAQSIIEEAKPDFVIWSAGAHSSSSYEAPVPSTC